MNILVRADSSSYIGTGHIMRDLVLAKQYKNENIIFATQDLVGNINHQIIETGYKIELLKELITSALLLFCYCHCRFRLALSSNPTATNLSKTNKFRK
jgi:hypothetical protein